MMSAGASLVCALRKIAFGQPYAAADFPPDEV